MNSMTVASDFAQPNQRSGENILLIDLENCPAQIDQLQHNLEQFSQVVICYAQTGAKVPLDWLVPLSQTVNANKLKIFKMASNGKNAADFGICFFAGMLMQQLPADTHFVIVSNDHDLDHAVNLLISQGRSAERVGTIQQNASATSQPSDPTATANSKSGVVPLKTYCTHLMTYSKNRPAKKDTLLNSIKNKFKDNPAAAKDVLRLLMDQGVITITDGKVNYHDGKIRALAQ